MATPKDNGIPLDRFNDAMRQSPAWQDFVQRAGFRLDGSPIKLTESQRKQLAGALARAGFDIPRGMEVDPSGNLNQADNGFFEKKSVRIGLAAAAALATAGAAGWAPLAGAFGSSGAGAAGAATGASGAAGASTAAGIAGGAMSTYDIAKDVMKAFGAGASDYASASAHNRGVRAEADLAAEQTNVARRADDRDARSDAWRASQQAAYVSSPDRGKAPGVAGQYSRSLRLPDLDPAIVAARAQSAKDTLTRPYQDFEFDENDMNPSGLERAANIAGPVAGVVSSLPGGFWSRLGKLIR